MKIPIKLIGLAAISFLIGLGLSYSFVSIIPIKTEIKTTTETKIIEKMGDPTTTTITKIIQERKTVTTTITGYATTFTEIVTAPQDGTNTTQTPKVWTTIETFEGDNDTITNVFQISSIDWKIVYTIEANKSPIFKFWVYRSDEPLIYKLLVTEHESGTRTIPFSSGPANFFLKIEAKNVKWKIEIQAKV
jgi:hypothetical protein